MSRLTTVVFFVAICAVTVNSARILGVYPMPSISHQVVFRALTLELVKRGHEVVVITPNPAFKDATPPANLTEIDISDAYNFINKQAKNQDLRKYFKRGVIIDFDFMSRNKHLVNMLHVFDYDDVNKLLGDKNQKFDLVIAEGLAYSPLIFSKVFNAPAILFSSLYGTNTNYEAVGACSRHPLLYQSTIYGTSKFKNLSIMEKIEQIITEFKIWMIEKDAERMENEFMEARFGPGAPTVEELKKNVVLLFSNIHPIFDNNRPVPPGNVYLGSMHMEPIKELPQDLKTYLDSSTRGVVYVSLGTNVRPTLMDKDLLEAFLKAFEAIPFDILWKFDGDGLQNVPKNVKMEKWFPQRDLLGHPNIKLFVTQGGLQSTDEAIDAEVPLVGIPMIGDQFYNTIKYVDLGIGARVDPYTLVAEDLVKAVNVVASDPSYKTNIKNLKAIMQDQQSTPLERAVWWTEHVLRHPHSKHLLGPSAQMSWTEYLMLDVLAFLAVVATILFSFIGLSIYFFIRLFSRNNSKVKKH